MGRGHVFEHHKPSMSMLLLSLTAPYSHPKCAWSFRRHCVFEEIVERPASTQDAALRSVSVRSDFNVTIIYMVTSQLLSGFLAQQVNQPFPDPCETVSSDHVYARRPWHAKRCQEARRRRKCPHSPLQPAFAFPHSVTKAQASPTLDHNSHECTAP